MGAVGMPAAIAQRAISSSGSQGRRAASSSLEEASQAARTQSVLDVAETDVVSDVTGLNQLVAVAAIGVRVEAPGGTTSVTAFWHTGSSRIHTV